MPEEHEGHMAEHYHRAPILPPDEDKAYSELNHHIAGVFVLLAGALALLAAAENPRSLRSRLVKILNVPQRVRLRCSLACGLVSGAF
jgi:hypothetical protein